MAERHLSSLHYTFSRDRGNLSDLCSSTHHKRFGGFKGTAPVQMLLEFVAPLLHDADGGQRRGVAERAEGAAQHIFGEVADEVDVFRTPETSVKTIEHLA